MKHLNQIKRALGYIDKYLVVADRDSLDIEYIAREAGMSLWHFQRMFNAMTGETVAAYIRKRRLTDAAARLLKSDERILEIALASGFESQESFTRAFHRQFDCSPAKFRKEKRIIPPVLLNTELDAEYLDHLYKGMSMQPDITTMEPFTLIGLEARFYSVLSENPDNTVIIPELLKRARSLITGQLYGVIDYKGVNNVTDPILYFAGVAVKKGTPVPQGLITKQISGGLYASFRHNASFADITHTVNYIHGNWLPRQTDLELRDDVEIEIFEDNKTIPAIYCLPVKKSHEN